MNSPYRDSPQGKDVLKERRVSRKEERRLKRHNKLPLRKKIWKIIKLFTGVN